MRSDDGGKGLKISQNLVTSIMNDPLPVPLYVP